jgi:hypothetical protein
VDTWRTSQGDVGRSYSRDRRSRGRVSYRVHSQTVSQLHQILIAVGRVNFTDFTLRSVFTANSRLAKVVPAKFMVQSRVCAVLCEISKQAANLSEHQDGGCPSAGISEIMNIETSIAEILM